MTHELVIVAGQIAIYSDVTELGTGANTCLHKFEVAYYPVIANRDLADQGGPFLVLGQRAAALREVLGHHRYGVAVEVNGGRSI